jgi:hypothetical protein
MHINGSPTLGKLLISPNEPNSSTVANSEIFLAEDNDGTYGMNITYDGGDNKLYIGGKSSANIYGPHLSIERNNGLLTLSSGTGVNEFSIDGTLAGNSDNALPTEQAVKTYVDAQVSTVNSTIGAISIDDLSDGSDGLGTQNLFLGINSGGANVAGGNYNVGIGVYSLTALTTGDYNSSLGRSSLYKNTTGSANNAYGYVALYNNLTGNYNVANGYASLYSLTSGSYNNGIGYASMYYATSTNDYNVAVGRQAMRGTAAYTGSDFNVAIGDQSLYKIGTGALQNTSIGAKSMYELTTGDYNTSIGYASLYKTTTGFGNTSLGYYSMNDNTTGYYNAATGHYALGDNTTGYYNSAFGVLSLRENTEGFGNSGFGYASLYNNLTGDYNVAMGYQAGYNAIGDKNVFIGLQAGYNETGSNKLYIDNSTTSTPLIYGDFSANVVDVNGDLEVSGGHLNVGAGSSTGRYGMQEFVRIADWQVCDETQEVQLYSPDDISNTTDGILVLPPGASSLTVYRVEYDINSYHQDPNENHWLKLRLHKTTGDVDIAQISQIVNAGILDDATRMHYNEAVSAGTSIYSDTDVDLYGYDEGTGSCTDPWEILSIRVKVYYYYAASAQDGDIVAGGRVYANTKQQVGDVAEYFPVRDGVEPGLIVAYSEGEDNGYKLANKSYSNHMVGVISKEPSVVLNDPKEGPPVGLTGRVIVKLVESDRLIKGGDFITSSNQKGLGQVAERDGPVIGYAVTNQQQGEDFVEILLQPGRYYKCDNNTSNSLIDNLKSTTTDYDGLLKRIEELEGAIQKKSKIKSSSKFRE